MKKLLLLLLGLLLIVLLSYYCFKTKTETIENYLLSSAEEIYTEKSLTEILVSVKGEDFNKTRILVLTGLVDSIEEKEDAETIAQNIHGVYAVENNLQIKESLIPLAKTLIPTSHTPKLTIRQPMTDVKEVEIEEVNTTFENLVPTTMLELTGKKPLEESEQSAREISTNTCEERLKEKLAHEKIHFEYNKVLIKESSYTLLNELIEIFKGCSKGMLYIEGHTDSKGTTTYNQLLSQKRANAIKTYFVKHGIKKENLTAFGYGETYPLATNKTEAGKKLNRRIEFKIKGVK